ncbi:hypothetical protein PENANT_c035G09860 [Penicillium antarcticum]|uniref:DUF4246 domain-containing protein n=1 Tax=Penicillium antarcticum TaxID=416450 RepID=A0A1V6PTX8_9EURO|nr:hypothetical protein PENANT_c035G09860 [Penicillium antarcticum]
MRQMKVFMTSACFDYCMEELCDKADFYQKFKMVLVFDSALAVVKSDFAVKNSHCDYYVPDKRNFGLLILDYDGGILESNTRKLKYEDTKEIVNRWESARFDDFDPNDKDRLRDWFNSNAFLGKTDLCHFCTLEVW